VEGKVAAIDARLTEQARAGDATADKDCQQST
jgi:hypothetical protein